MALSVAVRAFSRVAGCRLKPLPCLTLDASTWRGGCRWRPVSCRPARLTHAPERAVVAFRTAAAASAAGGTDDDKHSSVAGGSSWLQSVQAFVSTNYLPVALVSALALGAANPTPGLAAADWGVPAFATCGIFLVQGLQLRKKEAMAALSMRREIAFGLASILVLTPLLGTLVAQLPLSPALALGLGVVCTVPTTLATGVAYVQQLGGNVSLALLLTVASNIMGVFTMPLFLPHIVAAASLSDSAGAGAGAAAAAGCMIDPVALVGQLSQTILLPTFIGACIRGFIPGAATAIDTNRKTLAYTNAALVASVPWIQISKTASQHVAVDLPSLLAAGAAAVGVIFVSFAANTACCRLLRIGGPDPSAAKAVRRTLVIVASLKSLPVAVTVLTKLGLEESVVGIAMLPVVFWQLSQIISGAFIVSRWLKT